MQSTLSKELDDYIKKLKKTTQTSFIAGDSLEGELKYMMHNQRRYLSILSTLDLLATTNKKLSLLDIGTSPLTFILKKRYPMMEITTMDLTENFIDLCKEVGIIFQKGDLNFPKVLPTKNKYDVILFLEVLEHLKSNHQQVMNWVSSILNPGGICIIQTPNKESLKSRVLSVIGMGVWDVLSRRPVCPEEFSHHKEYSLAELVSLLEKVPNLNIVKAEHPIYFDTMDSSMVYRKYASILKPALYLHYSTTLLKPSLRRGMEVILVKNSPLGKKQGIYVPGKHFGLAPTPLNPKIAKDGTKEIIKTARTYIPKDLKQLSVLDAGSGWGEYAAEMSNYFGKVVGVEPLTDAYNYAISRYTRKKNISYFNSKIEDFRTKEKFDLITSLTVFEHMSQPEKSFTRIFSLLKVGGIIYLTAPNKYWLFEQHYGLPFLSWMPVKLANLYLTIFRGIRSYEDCSYSKSYHGMRKFFDQFNCSYDFILPTNADSAYLGCNSSNSSAIRIRKLGIKLIRFNPFFWNFSKGFIMVIKKR